MIQLSAKTQNACLAALELARRHDAPQPVSLKTIAEAQQISSQFLVQILLQLKRAGIVLSTRGAGGGYRLARSPQDINLFDIISAMEGADAQLSTLHDTALARVLAESWASLVEEHQLRLREITLESLRAQAESPVEDMYYI